MINNIDLYKFRFNNEYIIIMSNDRQSLMRIYCKLLLIILNTVVYVVCCAINILLYIRKIIIHWLGIAVIGAIRNFSRRGQY